MTAKHDANSTYPNHTGVLTCFGPSLFLPLLLEVLRPHIFCQHAAHTRLRSAQATGTVVSFQHGCAWLYADRKMEAASEDLNRYLGVFGALSFHPIKITSRKLLHGSSTQARYRTDRAHLVRDIRNFVVQLDKVRSQVEHRSS